MAIPIFGITICPPPPLRPKGKKCPAVDERISMTDDTKQEMARVGPEPPDDPMPPDIPGCTLPYPPWEGDLNVSIEEDTFASDAEIYTNIPDFDVGAPSIV